MKLVYLLVLTLGYGLLHHWLGKLVMGSGAASRSVPTRIQYVRKTISIVLAIIYFVLLGLVLGLNYGEVAIFLSSAIAVLGVALFAQWSILSNLTASLVIFFGFPYRIGDRIRVLDKDDTVEGLIEEISLFTVQVRQDNGDLATFPNNLFLQKVVVKVDRGASAEEVQVLED